LEEVVQTPEDILCCRKAGLYNKSNRGKVLYSTQVYRPIRNFYRYRYICYRLQRYRQTRKEIGKLQYSGRETLARKDKYRKAEVVLQGISQSSLYWKDSYNPVVVAGHVDRPED
jgi:hypothetical protein